MGIVRGDVGTRRMKWTRRRVNRSWRNEEGSWFRRWCISKTAI